METQEKLDKIILMLQSIMDILTDKKSSDDFRGRKFVALENIFSSLDNVNPMLKQGTVYQVGDDNGVKLRYGQRKSYFKMSELLELYGDRIALLQCQDGL